MKKVFFLLVITGLAAAALAQPSYDAITGQSYNQLYLPGNSPVADDTTLANLNPVQSIDVLLQNHESNSDFYTVALTVYSYDPATGLPGTALTSMSQFVFVDAESDLLVNYAFSSLWTPPTVDLWTGITITGGPNLGWLIPNAAPTVGTSTDQFAQFDGTQWQDLYFGGNPVANFAIRYNAVPEPGSVAVMGLGVIGLALRRKRK